MPLLVDRVEKASAPRGQKPHFVDDASGALLLTSTGMNNGGGPN
jgi:hypothetical protein